MIRYRHTRRNWKHRKAFCSEKGLVLPTALMFLAVLALISTTAILTTTTDMKISANHRIMEQAYYCAVAGCEDARARLCKTAAHPIIDAHPTDSNWTTYIASAAQAFDMGYDSSNVMHARYDRLVCDFDYTVIVKHQNDSAGQLLLWGDSDGDGTNERNTTIGNDIYIITSFGSSGPCQKTLEAQVARMPDVRVPSALYVEAPSTIQGDTSYVLGNDACGTSDKPAVVTTENAGSVTLVGTPHIEGAGGSVPDILYSGTDVDVQSLVASFRKVADYAYVVDSVSQGLADTPGPGDGWGDPVPGATLQDPSSCSSSHIVHYDTGGTYVQLADGVSGCGMLLVEGDLDIHGDFSWYGPVLVTGSVVFTASGNKHITGALMAGGSVDMGVSGGNADIVYCSSAINGHTSDAPLTFLSWKEDL